MNRRKAMGSIIVGAAAAAPLALGADAEVEDWVGWWERSKTFVVKVVNAMPEADYSFKPFPEARSFGEEMQHLAQAEGFYLGNLGKGGRAPAAPRGDSTKATTVKYVTDVMDWSISVVKQLTAADITKSFGGGKGPAMTGLDLLLNAMVHTAHTRGYAEMYLRQKGIVPPTYAV
jgi:uncharacterized damage-inducible protein DinB